MMIPASAHAPHASHRMTDNGTKGLWQHFRDFFLSKANKEFLIFLFFLLLSGTFWLMMTLNETYEKEIQIPVDVVNVTKGNVLNGQSDDFIRVTVKDKGYTIFSYIYGDKVKTVTADFKTFARGNGKGVVPGTELMKMAYSQLFSSSKITALRPDKLEFYYNDGSSKRVPVRLLGKASPGQSYYISKTVFMPDSVTILAAQDILDSVKYVFTEPLQVENITDTVVHEIGLRKIKGVKCDPEVIKVAFYPDILTEESVEVPIRAINMPEGKILRTFPARVKVVFVTGASMFRSIKPEDFSVIVDYNELADKPSEKCNIYLRSFPHGVTKAHTVVEQVDYLIEQQ